jgi:hypothetical protein
VQRVIFFRPQKRAGAWRWRLRNKKPAAAFRPGDPRSFGEYAFLEDSRYTSQQEKCDPSGLPATAAARGGERP